MNAFYKDKSINLVNENEWDNAKSISSKIRDLIASILNVDAQLIVLEQPKNPEHGDFSINYAMIEAKKSNMNPIAFAQEKVLLLKDSQDLSHYVEKITIAGPGFINLVLNREYLWGIFIKATKNTNIWKNEILEGKKIMFEYAHPNPFKAFHIGHLRNIILGESLVRILEAHGAEVIRTNYQGDVGMHIAKCLYAFIQVPEAEYPTLADERVELIAKCYTQGAKAFEDEKKQLEIKEINRKIYSKEDAKINHLWQLGKQWSLDKFHQIYKRVGSHFVREYMESETLELCNKFIVQALEKGTLQASEGAIIFKGEKYGLDTRVFRNAMGLPTYEGKELGLAYLEFHDYGDIDLCIHNVAVEQISFFQVTFKVQALLDAKTYAGKQYHNAYEFVGLKSGKMSSRTGQVVLGNDILNEAVKKIDEVLSNREGISMQEKEVIAEKVGVGAVKYSFLNINPGSYLAFDLDKSLNFEGNSGPYLQYVYSRANKIYQEFLKSNSEIIEFDKDYAKKLTNEEIALIKKLLLFPEVIIDAGKNLAPNIITNSLFELAQIYNQFYKNLPILKSEDEKIKGNRVQLSKMTSEAMKIGLNLLGIEVVATM